MSIIFSDPQPARFCPHCYAIPCRCSRITAMIEALIRLLNRYRQHRYTTRQQEINGCTLR